MEGDRVLWDKSDVDGARGRLVLNGDDRYRPGYLLEVGYESEARTVELERAHLADLWLAILEQAESLEWASNALIREAGIRSVMRSRQVDREAAIFILDGGK